MAKRIYKSTKKLSSVKCVYRKWSEWDEGDVLIGKYVSQQTDNYKKPNWLIEVEDAQFTDKKAAKLLMPGDGEKVTIGLNSTGKVDAAMEQAEVGDTVQFEYKGMNEIESGPYEGEKAHDVAVDIVELDKGDDEDTDEEEETEEDDL